MAGTSTRHRRALAQTRRAASYTQERLAEALHLDRSTIVRWETAGSQPRPYLWPKLAKLLGVTQQELTTLFADETSYPVRR